MNGEDYDVCCGFDFERSIFSVFIINCILM